MELKVNVLVDFDFEKISSKLLSLAQASLGVWAYSYIRQTQTDVEKKNLFISRTGTLLRSIQAIPEGKLGIRIGVFAEYGKYLEFGTKSYIIKPKNRKALKIPVNGYGYVFTKKVKHPGIRERGWFLGSFEERSQVANQEMREYFKQGLIRIGET